MTKTRSSVTVTAVGYAKAIRDVSSFVRQRVGSSYSKRSIGTPDDHAASIRAIAGQGTRARADQAGDTPEGTLRAILRQAGIEQDESLRQ